VTSDRVVIEADGGSRGNPGPAGFGAVVFDAASHEVLAERSEFIGRETNNVAEYRGLIAGLTAARELGARSVTVRMDSKLVVEQMSGRWKVKHQSMIPLSREARELQQSFDDVSYEWIPREQNTHADRLTNEAMDRGPREPVRAPAGSAEPITWSPRTEPTRMILVRHGATGHSAEMRFSGRNDLALDDVGERQVAALAARAKTFGDVTAIISSPLRRTRRTADVIGAELGLPVVENEDLAEIDFGEWEGMTIAEVGAAHPNELNDWRHSPDMAPPGGESLTALERRVRRGRDAVIAAYPGSTVVVVSHVSPIKALVRLALDAPPSSVFRMYLSTGSISIIDYHDDGSASLRLYNDTSHLALLS
jgi:probable phosphoglycerate mutase